MKYKVILGSVLTDNGEVKKGDFVRLSENDAKLLMREGVVEPVVEEKPEPKKVEKPKKKVEKPVKEEVEPEPEPSLDWTRKELDEYAKSKGLEPKDYGSKKELLKAIEEVK